MTKHPDLFAALAAPFEPHEVKTRNQAGRQVPYVTARTVMNRLDDVLGPENWWNAFAPAGENSVLCSLTLRLPDGSTVTKQDAGGAAGMVDSGDDDKSAHSDALKRAAVLFGVGRYLYRDGVPRFARAASASAEEKDKPRPQPLPAPKPDPRRDRDRERLPSQARPQSTPEPERPRDGKALYRWCKTVEERRGVGMLKYLSNWGKLQDFGGRVVDWHGDQVYAAWQEGRRKLEAMESEPATSTN